MEWVFGLVILDCEWVNWINKYITYYIIYVQLYQQACVAFILTEKTKHEPHFSLKRFFSFHLILILLVFWLFAEMRPMLDFFDKADSLDFVCMLHYVSSDILLVGCLSFKLGPKRDYLLGWRNIVCYQRKGNRIAALLNSPFFLWDETFSLE